MKLLFILSSLLLLVDLVIRNRLGYSWNEIWRSRSVFEYFLSVCGSNLSIESLLFFRDKEELLRKEERRDGF